jgi:hypothetical protein
MKLHEFAEYVKAEREALRLTNLEKISTIVNVTTNERQTND